jgi:hypothetical protein
VRRALLTCLLAAASLGAADRPAVSREEMATIELSVDRSIRGLDQDDPYDLLGFTRGVYLPGYGVVVTAEVNLVITPITPFHQTPTGARLTRLRLKKVRRLTVIRDLMRTAMLNTAATLDPVPSQEQIVFALTLFYCNFEEREGLPGQIIMTAPKQTLIDFKANKITKTQLDAAIQVQEL